MDRRTFLGVVGAGVAFSRPRGLAGASSWLRGSNRVTPRLRFPLPLPATVRADDLTLVAGPTAVDFGAGQGEAWTINGEMPAPTIRLERGETAQIRLENQLPESTILHWHGLDVPEQADGHPRLAIDPGEVYEYEFPVQDRAGLYWYHPHPHGRTAKQTYQGMAGLLVIEDDEERSLELPGADFEIPLLLQDKRLGDDPSLEYAPARMGPDRMYGYLGDTAFGNGMADPTVEVTRGRHRLRILNGSNARILDLGLSTEDAMVLIGTDGGLLERPVSLPRIMMGTGERADLIVDFSRFQAGDRIILRSYDFEIPGAMGMGGGGRMGGGMHAMMPAVLQGVAMDFVEFVVTDGPTWDGPPLPDRLSRIDRPLPSAAQVGEADRVFRFDSAMMRHSINGQPFEMARVDATIARGQSEIWSLVNEGPLAHPVHIHAGQFRVVAREGGRARVMPWETGLKDTVLVWPGETAHLSVRFDRHPGLFLLHCHNLEHEDAGMMSNFRVE